MPPRVGWVLALNIVHVISNTQSLVNTHEPQEKWGMIRRGRSRPQWPRRAFNSLAGTWKERQYKTMSAILTQTWNKHNNQKWKYIQTIRITIKESSFGQHINHI
jgi:hypothetical protein